MSHIEATQLGKLRTPPRFSLQAWPRGDPAVPKNLCGPHPKIGSNPLRLYKDGYRDGIDAIDEHGCVDVPEGSGLGVEYDWDFILAHRSDGAVYK